MEKTFCKWFITIACASVNTLFANFSYAQITPDETLPTNSSVTKQGNINVIENGTTAGSNLFHSLNEFSVPTGSEVHFKNAVDISNIITRVTGKSISNIDGLIKANGSANLFLINPNGIVFGENARLDIGGSFVGSTANSIKFADDIEFSATNPLQKPLLTVNLPLGLQYGANPGRIEVTGKSELERETPEVFEPKSGLKIPDSNTLALLGGDVLLEGATLKAASGRIELGSVTGEGFISIAPVEKGFSFGFDKLENFGEIRLSQNSAVDTKLAQGCTAGSSQAQSRFEITGRGGLPTLPSEALSTDAIQVDLVTLKPSINNSKNPSVIDKKPTASKAKKIIEATGWIQNDKGEILFVADASNRNSVSSWHKPTDCSAVKSNNF